MISTFEYIKGFGNGNISLPACHRCISEMYPCNNHVKSKQMCMFCIPQSNVVRIVVSNTFTMISKQNKVI